MTKVKVLNGQLEEHKDNTDSRDQVLRGQLQDLDAQQTAVKLRNEFIR
jgi:hypothetical protein